MIEKEKRDCKGLLLTGENQYGFLERIRQVFVGTSKWFIFQEVRVLIL